MYLKRQQHGPFRVKRTANSASAPCWCNLVLVGLCAFLGTAVSLAHHSTALYVVRVTEFQGKLAAVSWRNPHVQLTVDTRHGRESIQPLIFLADNVNNLEHAGLTRESLVVGETVSITGRRSGRFENRVLAQSIRLTSGREFQLWLGD